MLGVLLEFVIFFGLFIGVGLLVLRICKEGDYDD